jgi:short-chain Z-isoprenyl diphosphate synthase
MEEEHQVSLERPLYGLYERRLAASLSRGPIPRHVGVILDGNRRWARESGGRAVEGHRAGGNHVQDFLHWCEDVGVEVVTLWMLSTDNLTRAEAELTDLIGVIEDTVCAMAATRRWRLRLVGAPQLLPTATTDVLRRCESDTADVVGLHVNVAVGYGGRQEITDAVRSLLQAHAVMGTPIEQLAEILTVEHIAEHLYTKGQPDPDLVIRTSGEQRLGGFLLWQSAHS